MSALLLALLLPAARADDPLPRPPEHVERMKVGWYDADGQPVHFDAIEGWLLKDPDAAPHVVKRHQLRAAGTTLLGVGTTAAIVGVGVVAREYADDQGNADQFVTWVPLIGGVVLVATSVPLLVFGNKEGHRAVEVYGGPEEGGAHVTVGGSF